MGFEKIQCFNIKLFPSSGHGLSFLICTVYKQHLPEYDSDPDWGLNQLCKY